MKVGDRVRWIGLPENLPEHESLPTRATFERCLGQVFITLALNEIGWVELNIESVTGSVNETIWVEPEFLEIVSSSHG